jgi:hypothetical protein
MKIWWRMDDSFRYCLHDEYDEIHHIGAIKLTEAEWKDYQRVEEEYQAWQERIESLTKGPPAQPGSDGTLVSSKLSRSAIAWLLWTLDPK